MKKITALLLALIMVLSMAACGNTGNDGSGSTPETITVGTTMEINKAEKGEYNFDQLASGCALIPLVYLDESGNYGSDLIEWETEDSKTWTVTVKDGVKWSNGDAFRAEDIKLAIETEDSMKDAFEAVSIENGSLKLVLPAANVRFLSNFASLRPACSGNAPEDAWLGPYTFEEFNAEAGTVTFVKNSDWSGDASPKTLVYQLFDSDDTMYLALANGDVDLVWNYSTGIPVNYQSVLADSENVQLVTAAGTNEPAVLAFNNSRGPFADKNLRFAVSCALNYEELRSYLGSEYSSVPNRGFVPEATIGCKATESLKQDLDAANKYMEAAGYTKKSGESFYTDKDGRTAGFALTVNASKEAHVAAAELVKNQLEAFGIKVELDALDSTGYNAKTSNKFSENNITMEAAIFGYTASGMAMMNGLGTIYVDGSHAVQGGCRVFDEKFVKIRDAMAAAPTIDEYKAAAGDMQDFYASECPLLALYWDNFVYGMSADFKACEKDANFGLNNYRNWFTLTK